MQREEPDGIVIACDFCGTDWDMVQPMIEGHQGSVVCLACLKQALAGAFVPEQAPKLAPQCTMCLRELKPDTRRWTHPDRPEAANPDAVICQSCIRQAATAFSRDPETQFEWKGSRRG